jgi:hypothetical protein
MGYIRAHINDTSSNVFHSNKTYSSIPLIFPLDVVESVSLCQSDLRRSVLSHLPLASRIVHLELGNSNFRQAGVELLGPQGTIRMLNRLNAERKFGILSFLESGWRLIRLNCRDRG